MYCYNCGTDCKEDRFCSNCGCRVGKPEEREKIYPDPPLGLYQTLDGCLEVCEEGVRVCNSLKSRKFPGISHFIYYKNIWEVRLGHNKPILEQPMIIKEKGDIRDVAKFPSDWKLFHKAETILFLANEFKSARIIYGFLAKCAEINRQQEIRE